jgi:hypothetical protein
VSKRKAISKSTRFEVFKRDGFTCQYCGAHPPQVVLHLDHIKAVANGGGDGMDNLITSCITCNLGKAARPLDTAPQSLKDKAADIADREEQLRGYYEIIEARRERMDREMWAIAEVLIPGCSTKGFNRADLQSIRRFLDRLDYYEVLDAMEASVAKIPYSVNQAFKYFCGTCWAKIREADAG